ncbi:hypothetical protein HY948_04325 [Candidatus Gottesmanbacteria bacterium]|nr:hypothetical protein [Candidatus Gottesmanbacteria bacterium]
MYHILLIALLFRLAILFLFPQSRSSDLHSLLIVGDEVLRAKTSYTSNYFPFISYLGAVAVGAKPWIDPYIFLKSAFILFDIGIVWLVYRLSNNKVSALFYAVNPIPMITGIIHGQFDAIPSFFLLLSAYLITQKKSSWSMVALSFGIFVKTWPFLFAVPIMKQLHKKKFLILVPLLPLAATLFHSWYFHVPLGKILYAVKDYRGVWGVWGFGFLIPWLLPSLDASWIQLIRRISLLSFAGFAMFIPSADIIQSVLVSMLFLFSITVTFGAQWVSWLVPWLCIARPCGWQWFMGIATAYVAITFAGDVVSISPATAVLRDQTVLIVGIILWGVILVMLRDVLKKLHSA